MFDDLDDEKTMENLYGLVAIHAYNDGTYVIRTSMDMAETHELIQTALQDIEDGDLEGIDDFDSGHLH